MRGNTKASITAFSDTRAMFREYFDGKDTYSYVEWKHLPEDCKAAALYLNFYDTIMTSLYKARVCRPVPGDDADLVSAALEKCEHVIAVLDEQPEKYTRGYMSLVMYNILGSELNQLISSRQKQFNVFQCFNFSETSDVVEADSDKNYNMIETASTEDILDAQRIKKIIDDQPEYVQDIIEKIINGGKLGKKQQQIIPYLQEIFSEFDPAFC